MAAGYSATKFSSYPSHGDGAQRKRETQVSWLSGPFQDCLSFFEDSGNRAGTILITYTQQMNERPLVSHNNSDLILETQVGTQGAYEGNRMEYENLRTSWGLQQKGEMQPLWPLAEAVGLKGTVALSHLWGQPQPSPWRNSLLLNFICKGSVIPIVIEIACTVPYQHYIHSSLFVEKGIEREGVSGKNFQD